MPDGVRADLLPFSLNLCFMLKSGAKGIFLLLNTCKYLELLTKTDNKSDKTTIKMMESKNKKKIAKMC